MVSNITLTTILMHKADREEQKCFKGIESHPQILIFYHYIFATQCRRPLIFFYFEF